MRFYFFSCLFMIAGVASLFGVPTQTRYLSGTGSDDTVDWEFKVNGGRNSGEWSTIPVPSNWEMQDFGTYHYWEDWNETKAPDSLGQYRHRFEVPADWKGQHVELVFGAAMTDTRVRINGESAGPVHQGGFYQFSYDVTDLLHYGEENLLEVDVSKYSSNESVNLAEREGDYWLFGGIFRPVWLEAKPASHIDRLAVDARHDGAFSVEVFLGGVAGPARLKAEVLTLEGKRIASTRSTPVTAGQTEATLEGTAKGIQPWSAEWPHLYRLRVTLEGKASSHRTEETIGFRTIELRPKDGFYLNGEKIVLKGANRHTIWPETGRATNASLSEEDVRLMKAMNMNAVRMSHYPPDPHFLAACDRLGLYVIDELAGWQKSYDTAVGTKLVEEMVTRDVNHPAILLWSNGNEGGWNTDLDDDFALYDPQARTVIHPHHNFNGINAAHYEAYDSGVNWFFHGTDLIMPTEFLHGLYDGGHGAGLDDWWKAMLAHPLGLGGFLWSFADEGIVRDDQDGAIDVAGNLAPDGIVGPHREKEGSFYTIQEIWAPIDLPQTELDFLPPSFRGALEIENRYAFTNLDQLSFHWQLYQLQGQELADMQLEGTREGRTTGPNVAPGQRGVLQLDLPEDWYAADVLSLQATDAHGREIYTWTWTLRSPEEVAQQVLPDLTTKDTASEQPSDGITLRNGAVTAVIDPATGRLQSLSNGAVESPLRNGPILLEGAGTLTETEVDASSATFHFDGNLRRIRWQLHDDGWLQLDYTYWYDNEAFYGYYFGVTFDYDEATVEGMRWLGKGPFRVWKNRRKGVEFGLWQKDYNDTITGMSWDYPEFKGFHDDVYWAQLQSDTAPLDLVIASPDIALRVFTPTEAPEPRNTHVDFPAGDLSFLHAIAPIGTKFKTADQHGPQGRPSWPHWLGQTLEGRVYFRIPQP
ncbi:MAG: glycoside hydrolase [Puniceicoccaceae bacterium 5H]|nr:MAG: glycoside hydrolase [Puniceicoccaceae bacterium 5H]